MRTKLVLILIGLLYSPVLIKSLSSLVIETEKVILISKNLNYIEKLLEAFKAEGIEFPEVFLAQILHETSGLTSKIYTQCNNVCGMKVNSRQFHCGPCRGHAKYKSKLDSIKDYAAYQKKYLRLYEQKYKIKVVTEEDYIQFLLAMDYAQDRKYDTRIRNWLNIIKKLK